MEVIQRKSITDDLSKYDVLANNSSFIEVTEWGNSEGIDVQIDDKKHFSLTYGELEAIIYLKMSLYYNKE